MKIVICGLFVLGAMFDGMTEDEIGALATVSKLGGHVERNPKARGNPVEVVSLGKTNVTDDHLEKLHDFKRLLKLDLQETSVSDAGMAHLGPSPRRNTG